MFLISRDIFFFNEKLNVYFLYSFRPDIEIEPLVKEPNLLLHTELFIYGVIIYFSKKITPVLVFSYVFLVSKS